VKFWRRQALGNSPTIGAKTVAANGRLTGSMADEQGAYHRRFIVSSQQNADLIEHISALPFDMMVDRTGLDLPSQKQCCFDAVRDQQFSF